MIVQDDVLFASDPQIREYLEHILWPGKRPGIASLFCSQAYTTPEAGWLNAFDDLGCTGRPEPRDA